MSLSTWKKEYYTVKACKMSKVKALKHSLKKWIGLRSKNLKKHGLKLFFENTNCGPYISTYKKGIDCGKALAINNISCALCMTYPKNCIDCPLYISEDRCSEDDRGYGIFIINGNVEVMIKELRYAIKKLKEKTNVRKNNVCPNCKDEFSDSTICGKCGYRLRLIIAEKATEFIENCPFCNHKVYNSRICPNCGVCLKATTIENLVKQVKCDACGTTLERINGDYYRCNNCSTERKNKMPDFAKAMTVKDNGKGTVKATQSKFQGMAVAINMNLEELGKIATELAGRLYPIMEKYEEKACLKKESIGDSEVLVWMTGVNESIEIIKGQLEEILERIEI